MDVLCYSTVPPCTALYQYILPCTPVQDPEDFLFSIWCFVRRELDSANVPVQSSTRWYSTIDEYVPMLHSAIPSTYLLVLGFQNLLLVCTLTNLVCTWYVLGTNWYIHGKTKVRICITLEFEPWISCITTSAQYHYATSVHSMVIHGVNTRYIATENAACVARYLLAGVGTVGVCWTFPPRPRINLNFQDSDAHFSSAIDCP